MDPLFELAGLLLTHFDDEWVPKPARQPRPHRPRQRGAIEPELRPGETLHDAEFRTREIIAIVKREEREQRAPHARETPDVRRPDGVVERASSGQPLDQGFESLRMRRELLTEYLYDNPLAALVAARAVASYPSYIVDITSAVTDEVARGRDSVLAGELEQSNDRLGAVVNQFAPASSVADRLLVDRTFAIRATQLLELPQPFAFVLQQELEEISRSRWHRSSRSIAQDPLAFPDRRSPAARSSDHAVRRALESDLFGVALSGGGIRSATFGLGVLQSLATLGLLHHVDYLSTVSGGGYIGSWLTGWIKRLHGGVHEVQQRLCPRRAPHPNTIEARPIRALREYSNYLTPRVGFLTGDTWTMVVTWFRNTLLNLLVILLLLMGLLVVPHWLVPLSLRFGTDTLLATFLLATFASVVVIAWNLTQVDAIAVTSGMSNGGPPQPVGAAAGRVTGLVVVPMVIGGLAAAAWMWRLAGSAAQSATAYRTSWMDPVVGPWTQWVRQGAGSIGLDVWSSDAEWQVFAVAAGTILIGLLLVQLVGRYDRCVLRLWGRPHSLVAAGAAHVVCVPAALVAAIIGGGITALLYRWIATLDMTRGYWTAAALLPPLVTETLAVTVALHIGLLGRDFPDERREWWSRLGAQQLLVSSVWAIGFAGALFAPQWVWNRDSWTQVSAVVGWVATTWGGVLVAKSKGAGSGSWSSSIGRWIAVIAPYVFIVGLLIAVSTLLQWSIFTVNGTGTQWLDLPQLSVVTPQSIGPSLWICLAALVACFVLSLRVDVNEFSMHHFYKNRLVRCFLGASRDQAARRPNRFTGFDPDDDLKLSYLRLDPSVASATRGDTGLRYVGPFPIVNTALNLTKGRELAWQERKAESFVFTPLHTGYELTDDRPIGGRKLIRAGYRPTANFGYPDGPALGTVAAISGAAANPNMGYHSSPATAFLLTVFNVRLGWWVGNPRYSTARLVDPWRTSSPRLGLMYLASELTGAGDNRTRYVNVSDGGHFENLGIYELVRRRCRFILAVDAEQDGGMSFAGLANAIRKCRTDFGVSIELDIDAIRKQQGRSQAHCTAGRIYYPEPGALPGHILYVKSSLTGDEPPDVLEYEQRATAFPHESTADQWFDESQFESYRMLGYHVGREALGVAVDCQRALNRDGMTVASLFEHVRELWTPSAGTTADVSESHANQFAELFAATHERVPTGLADSMLFTGPPATASRDTLYVAHAMIELMNRVFVDQQLDRFASRPHNAGWMRIFQRWRLLPDVVSTWAAVQCTYGHRFRAFMEQLPTWHTASRFN